MHYREWNVAAVDQSTWSHRLLIPEKSVSPGGRSRLTWVIPRVNDLRSRSRIPCGAQRLAGLAPWNEVCSYPQPSLTGCLLNSHTFSRRGLRAAITASVLSAACSRDAAYPVSPPQKMSPVDGIPRAAMVGGICDYGPVETVYTAAGWSKVFDESFSTGLSKWFTWYGGAFNEELQLYQAGNLQVAGGILSISARQESASGPTTPFDATPKLFGYTSGRIESLTHFSSSRTTPNVRMVARLKLPNGYGMWPAFWSYGDPWPVPGEIDIVEGRGQEPFTYYTAYWWGRRAGVNLVQNSSATINSSVSLTECWHVYEVIWSKNDLTFLLDGQIVDVKSGGYIPNMYRKEQRITLNLAVGGLFFPGLNPALIQTGTMQADWVKVFVKP